MKILVVLVLIVIVGSLGQALYYLLKDRERSPRTVRALTLRIGLSIGLFVLLLISFSTGLIKPHGLRPGIPPKNPTPPSVGTPAQPQ